MYTSESRALAILEVLVHLGGVKPTIPFSLVEASIPDQLTVETVSVSDLPLNWRRYPAPIELEAFGDHWLGAGRTAALVVPSAVVEHERNFLLNPAHGDFASVEIVRISPFEFDPRLFPSG